MSVRLPSLPGLEGLTGLARRDGVDIRPTLLRVLTDLYVQKPTHTFEEQRHYMELMLGLLDSADVATRTVIARTLAHCPDAPRPVIQRLAREVLEVADPVLRYSPCLTSNDLISIIEDFGPSYAAVISQRDPTLSRAAGHAIGDRPRTDRAPELPIQGNPDMSGIGAPPPIEIIERFFAGGPMQRRRMLIDLQGLPPSSTELPRGASDDAIAALEDAALERRRHDLVLGLERSLTLSQEQAEMIVADWSGELIVVAAKALAIPSDVFVRILLFINTDIGESVERVYDLTELYGELRREVAVRLMAPRTRSAPMRRPSNYQPTYAPESGVGARQAATPSGRRQIPSGQQEDVTRFGRRQRTI